MFQEILKSVVDGVDGGQAGLVMDFEGIVLESYTRPGTGVDITSVGAEYSVILKAIQKASEMLESGAPSEIQVKSSTGAIVLRILTSTYFVAIGLDARGNVGKARFLLRTRAAEMVKELS